MKFTAILFATLLTGCYQSLNNTDLKKAMYTCKDINNIDYIKSTFIGDEIVKCTTKPSSEFLNEVVLP